MPSQDSRASVAAAALRSGKPKPVEEAIDPSRVLKDFEDTASDVSDLVAYFTAMRQAALKKNPKFVVSPATVKALRDAAALLSKARDAMGKTNDSFDQDTEKAGIRL